MAGSLKMAAVSPPSVQPGMASGTEAASVREAVGQPAQRGLVAGQHRERQLQVGGGLRLARRRDPREPAPRRPRRRCRSVPGSPRAPPRRRGCSGRAGCRARPRPACRSRGPSASGTRPSWAGTAGLSPRAASRAVRRTGSQAMPSGVPSVRQPCEPNQSSGVP